MNAPAAVPAPVAAPVPAPVAAAVPAPVPAPAPQIAPIDPAARPALLRGVRVRHDAVRGAWVLLAPERVLKLDPIAAAVLAELDGVRSFGEITAALAAKYDAPEAQIAADASRLIRSLTDRIMAEVRP
jgi:pyrroloquinoline quinone biosynthesis protein D